MTNPVLHSFFRSSTSTRVRIALQLKGIAYDYAAIHLRKGEQRGKDYLALNPQGLVPALEIPGEGVLTQSIAIIEYLDERYPEPPLLPADLMARAYVRSIAQAIACEIHPINNLRVLNHLASNLHADESMVADWFRHWVAETFGPLEASLAARNNAGLFCHGDLPGIADICIYAQVLNNRRFNIPLDAYPTIRGIYDNCSNVAAFQAAAPERQPDAE